MKNLMHQLMGDVAVMKCDGGIEVPQLTGAQVIYHYDLMAFREKPIDQVGANESSPSGYYDFFGPGHTHLSL